jgi:IS30 family transposase
MRCYSHLLDDEREQIGLAKAVGHSIGAIAKAIGRPKSMVSRQFSKSLAKTCKSGSRKALLHLALESRRSVHTQSQTGEPLLRS